jgi:hypothetical protein
MQRHRRTIGGMFRTHLNESLAARTALTVHLNVNGLKTIFQAGLNLVSLKALLGFCREAKICRSIFQVVTYRSYECPKN